MSLSLPAPSELFPGGDHEFKLTLRRTEPRAFFERQDPTASIVRERSRWLSDTPQRYVALAPEGHPLLGEFVTMAATWERPPDPEEAGADAGATQCAGERLLRLGTELEPDILFLSADEEGRFRLRGGALCFPTSWALEEKMGRTLEEIHGIVPGLNDALAESIRHFLAKLKPGVAYLRHNWGLAATDELNLHPARGLPAPRLPVQLDRLWLRVEHQALVALPLTRGIVFGIRIALHRLDQIAGGPAAAGLKHALASMPDDLAAYKRIQHVRTNVIRLL